MNGELAPTDDTTRIRGDSLTYPQPAAPAISHSYTSLSAYEDCPRQHYLEYVVNAFPDYLPTESGASDGASQRDIGVLFHDTAEQAARENTRSRAAWNGICERLATQRRVQDALPAAKRCIERYFELEPSEYELIDAEREFELRLDGHELVGYIDAVYRTPEDESLVIDYKATTRRRELDQDNQLPIYLLACRELYDEAVTRAGYAYVGEIGPDVATRSFDDDELQAVSDELLTAMNRITDDSYHEYTAGEHCQWCQHRQLPCAPDGLQPDEP